VNKIIKIFTLRGAISSVKELIAKLATLMLESRRSLLKQSKYFVSIFDFDKASVFFFAKSAKAFTASYLDFQSY
jgi:hypothetical protein